MAVCFIALGTNLGDRLLNLSEARRQVRFLGALREGPVFETRALRWPGDTVPQRPYLNVVDELTTALEPLQLLRACKRIERLMGRVPTYRWGPRLIDLDLICYGDVRMETPELTLPHPRAQERDFIVRGLRYFTVKPAPWSGGWCASPSLARAVR